MEKTPAGPLSILAVLSTLSALSSAVGVSQDMMVVLDPSIPDPLPPMPVLDSVAIDQTLYVVWNVTTPDDGATLRITIRGSLASAKILVFGRWFWDPTDLAGTRTGAFGWGSHGAVRAHIQSPIGPEGLSGDATRCILHEVLTCELIAALTRNVANSSNLMAMAMVGIDGTFDGSVTLHGTAGVQVLGRAVGKAFLDREEQFEGDLNIFVETPTWPSPKAMQNVATRHSVTSPFFGFFLGTTDTNALVMEYEGPDQSGTGRRLYLIEEGTPGEYVFRVPSDVETEPHSRVVVLGAGVVLP